MLDDVRSHARRRLMRAARGPGRTALRRAQARTPVFAGRRVGGPPDYVGIGVQRAGTSWWHSIIEAHPAVDPLGWTAKELHYFDDRWSGELTGDDIRDYAANFLRRPGHLSGEWTPRYLSDPWSVPLLRQAAPDAKLLVLLRDPLERLRSGLAHAHERLGGITPDIVTDAIGRGCYASQLAPVLATVPAEQLLVLQLEQCRAEPQKWADRTFTYLGLDGIAVTSARAANASSTTVDIAPVLLRQAQELYAHDLRRLTELLPDAIDPALWRSGPV